MMTGDSVHGRVVITSDGLRIGHVNAILLVEGELRIGALQVKLDKSAAERIGVEHSVLRGALIDVAVDNVQSIGDAVLLAVPIEGLRPTSPAGAQADTMRDSPSSRA
jgi:sporulation protein YlmC with PRC-barrel domain